MSGGPGVIADLAYRPTKVREEVRPLRWWEYALPWRWPRKARTVLVIEGAELVELSLVRPRFRWRW